jgi:hypothetical protein
MNATMERWILEGESDVRNEPHLSRWMGQGQTLPLPLSPMSARMVPCGPLIALLLAERKFTR